MLKKIIFALALVLTFYACKKESLRLKDKSDTINNMVADTQFRNMFYALPSPQELAQTIKEYPVLTIDSLNKTELANNYVTDYAKALNLGVYLTDLGYLISKSQTQYVDAYSSVLLKIASDLDINQGFNDTLIRAMRRNLNNYDSLSYYLNISMLKADAFIKESGRYDIAAYVATGVYIESLYLLATIISQNGLDNHLKTGLETQNMMISNLLALDSSVVSNNIAYKEAKKIKNIFKTIYRIKYEKIYDAVADTMRTRRTYILIENKKDIENFTRKIIAIRKKIISLE